MSRLRHPRRGPIRSRLAALPTAAIALVGLARLFDRFPPLAWLILAYLGMLLLWPYLDRRLVAPLHPVMVATVALGASDLLGRLRARQARAILVGAAAIWVASYSVVTAGRIAEGWPAAPYRLRAQRLAASVEALGRTAPDDAVIGALEFWAALHLHGGWTVAPSARFDPRSVDPAAPMWGTPEEQISLWRTAGIDHLLLEQAGVLHGAALDMLEAECAGTVFVLTQVPPLLVVRLAWDSTCEETEPIEEATRRGRGDRADRVPPLRARHDEERFVQERRVLGAHAVRLVEVLDVDDLLLSHHLIHGNRVVHTVPHGHE